MSKAIQSMSFYNGTLDKEIAKQWVNQKGVDIVYTYGLAYRHPTTYRSRISVAEAEHIIDTETLLDIDFEENEVVHLNAYSTNDMW